MTRRTFAGAVACCAASPLLGQSGKLRVRVKDRIQEFDLEAYTESVLQGEGSVLRSNDARKALAVAIRTYAVRFRGRHAAEGFDLCDTTHCQRFEPVPPGARSRSGDWTAAGEILHYQGKPALTYYSLDCGGRVEDVRDVWPEENAPYLKSHADPNCSRAGVTPWHWEISGEELSEALRNAGLRAPRRIESVTVLQRNSSTRAAMLALSGGGQTDRISASSLRFAVGRAFGFNTIKSDLYRAGVSGGRLVFDGTGVGHGVGLCQRGAEQMGNEGRDYHDILEFYFPGTGISVPPDKLSWRRVTGERISLVTTQLGQDASVLPIAERLLRAGEERTKLRAPRVVEMKVYPTVAAFIKETGEPGWIAARVDVRPNVNEILLQPLQSLRAKGTLEATLRHELLHVIIEANTRRPLPVWFREGLAEHFSNAGYGHSTRGALSNTGSGDTGSNDLRQVADESRARAAYEDARRQVRALIQRYGETTVLGWLADGLPREVTSASSRQPATNSK